MLSNLFSQEVHSPESEVIGITAKEGCAEGLVYGGGGEEGIFIKEVVPESPASKNLQLKEGKRILGNEKQHFQMTMKLKLLRPN